MMVARPVGIEVCVDSPEGLAAAVAGGADRVELCSALALGGLTPGAGLVAQAADCGLPVVAMIRPRPGDFIWTPRDISAMRTEIAAMRAAGLAGVVLGASRADGTLDRAALGELCDAAAGMGRVLHRAFDLVPDQAAALEAAVALGFDRILTSGGALQAVDGLDRLAALVAQAAGRLEILPGSGITPETAPAIVARLGVGFVHASCAGEVVQDPRSVAFGFAPAGRRETEAARIRALRRALG